MSNLQENIDLSRLSKAALPVARSFDVDKNGTLDAQEYKAFESIWQKEHKNESPLTMQLHINTLNDNALQLANSCDTEVPKGVLTGQELQKFMDGCEEKNITDPLKNEVSTEMVLTGTGTAQIPSNKSYDEKSDGAVEKAIAKIRLFTNWLKLDAINFKGSDKYFHAVGNYEAMEYGAEKIVKKVCSDQDRDKRANSKRSDDDYTEDLFANWLGREFAKKYPNNDPHELFKALAPEGFDIDESKESVLKIFYKNAKGDQNWFKKKLNEYTDFFKEDYIFQRVIFEIKGIFVKDEPQVQVLGE